MAGVWDDYYRFFAQDSTTHASDASSVISGGVNIFELAAGTQGAGARALRPTAAGYETVPRGASALASASALTAGTELYSAIYLPKDYTVTTVSFVSGTQAAVAPTHQLFGFRDSSKVLLGTSADATSAAWAANAKKSLDLVTPYVTTYAGLHYITLMATVTTTLPDLVVVASHAASLGLSPSLAATGDASLTTSLPATGGTLTAVANRVYGYVS